MSEQTPGVLVVGSINMDLVMQAERIPEAGESLLGEAYSYVPGGKGANQAVAAARLGLQVAFVGRVGNDGHGETLKRRLAREGVDDSLLLRDDRERTGFAAIVVERTGENRIIVFPGANLAIREEDVSRGFSRPLRAAIINLEISEETVVSVFRHARQGGVPVVLDAGPARGFDPALARGAEIVSPNATEGEQLTGIACGEPAGAARAAARLAQATAARYVVIKMGERGAYLFSGNGGWPHPAGGTGGGAVDTTAAGDAFTAGLTACYLRGGDIRQAVRYANAAGALAATRLGAQPSLPRAEAVAELLASRGVRL